MQKSIKDFQIKKVPSSSEITKQKTKNLVLRYASIVTTIILTAVVSFGAYNQANITKAISVGTGTVNYTKVVTNSHGGTATANDFSLSIKNAGLTEVGPLSGNSGSITLPEGTYTVSELMPTGYDTIGVFCGDTGGTASSITVVDGSTIGCASASNDLQGSLNVVINVTNTGNPGVALNASDVTVSVTGPTAIASFAGSASGTSNSVDAGNYTVSTSGVPANFTKTYANDCNSSGVSAVTVGSAKTCTVNLVYTAPAPTTGNLTVKKVVVNSEDAPSSFVLYVANDFYYASTTGSTVGHVFELTPSDYTVFEYPVPTGYTVSYSGDCSTGGAVTVAAGDNKICTVTNTYAPVVSPTPTPTTVTLTVTKSGDGNGTVVMGVGDTSSVCTTSQCDPSKEQSPFTQTYTSGTTIVLTATPDSSSNFNGSWSSTPNVCSGNNPVCTFTLTSNTTVNAHFALNPVVTPTPTPQGGGAVGVAFLGGAGGSGGTAGGSTGGTPQVAGAFTGTPSGLPMGSDPSTGGGSGNNGKVLGASKKLPRTGTSSQTTLAILALAVFSAALVRSKKKQTV